MPSSTQLKRVVKDYQLISLEENHVFKVRYDRLMDHVRSTELHFDEAERVHRAEEVKRREEEEWKAYIACDHLPKPHEPEGVRQFLYKTYLIEQEDIERTVNWMLGIDERSILCQDIDSPNKTRQHLHENKIDFGKMYDVHVTDAMEILRRTRYFVAQPDRQLSERIMNDVEHMKFFTFHQINRYIDNLSYRVLCSEEAYMEELDVTTMEYSYPGKHFDIHIWTFRNVPLYLDPQVTPFQMIDLHGINLKVNLPFGVLYENMVVRGLHCYFDHFSDHARFYEMPKLKITCTSLKDYLKWEWETQVQIQEDVRKMLIKLREDYEEAMILKAEEEAERARQAKKSGGDDKQGKAQSLKEKPKKPTKEPQKVEPGFVPFIRNDFLIYEEEFARSNTEQFQPSYFNLTEGEINLRKYQILGGIYQLDFLEKPHVAYFPNLIMAWYNSDNCINIHDVKMETSPDDEDMTKFFVITFTLPECYSYWGEPIPCHFEPGTSSPQEEELNATAGATNALTTLSPAIINDFNLHEIFDKPLMYQFIENTLPRVISSFQLPRDLYTDDDSKKSKTVGRLKLTAAQLSRERELEMQRKMLSFEKQKCPERLFPLFKKVLPIIIMPREVNEENALEEEVKGTVEPYNYYSDFLKALEEIKDNYRSSTFKDRRGRPIKIIAEEYERNIRRPVADIVEEKIVVSQEKLKSVGDISEERRTETKTEVKKRSTKQKMTEVVEEITSYPESEEEDDSTKWSTANILKSEVNVKDRKVTIWTDRLGVFGLAFYRYEHLPLTFWSLHPYDENPEEVELLLESKHARFRFHISSRGYRLLASDFSKLAKSRKVYLEINEPITDLHYIKQEMQQKHLNIFPERDYAFYVNQYFCEKHIAAESHVYKCISLYATSLKFKSSIWNKLSSRRIMTLRFGELRDLEEDLLQIRITPEEVAFVDIREMCTDLKKTVLQYTPTWRNLEWYPDVNYLIKSTYNGADEMRLKNANILCYLNSLLQAIRPLSCS